MVEHLSTLKITCKTIRTLIFVRCKALFEFSTMHDIDNMTVSIDDQNKNITMMESGDLTFPLSSKEKRSSSNSIVNNNMSMNNNNDQNTANFY